MQSSVLLLNSSMCQGRESFLKGKGSVQLILYCTVQNFLQKGGNYFKLRNCNISKISYPVLQNKAFRLYNYLRSAAFLYWNYIFSFLQDNRSQWGDQLYRTFPFSKGSVVRYFKRVTLQPVAVVFSSFLGSGNLNLMSMLQDFLWP
jgi:hypothetical protein